MLDARFFSLIQELGLDWDVIRVYWIIPAGMLVLYFYGIFHFNTPEYLLDVGSATSPATISGPGARLITPTPPIFTASRSRYNKYARRYVIILWISFISLIFLSDYVSSAFAILTGSRGAIAPSSAETLSNRAIWSLFALTGLLSSFPGFKAIDNWLLKTLHKAAFIPDEVRLLAETLYGSAFVARPSTLAAVASYLSMPDVVAVADGKRAGQLEQRVINILCLRNELQAQMTDRHARFKIALDRDLQEIGRQSQGLKAEVRAYLRDQEKIVPSSALNIDDYLADNSSNAEVAELSERRKLLQNRCDTIYETMCLITALFVIATTKNDNIVSETINAIGFKASQRKVAPLDWDAVARVVGSMFLLMILANCIYALINYLFNGRPSVLVGDQQGLRLQVIRYAILFTVVYSGIILFAIKLKRRWSRDDETDRPENLLIAIYSYLLALVCFSVPFSYVIRSELTFAPLLYGLNQGVLGYFIGIYIDRAVQKLGISYIVALWQGALQFVIGLIAMLTYPPPNLANSQNLIYIAIFISAQSGVSGFLIGIFFQYFYAGKTSESAVGSPMLARQAA